MMNRKSAGKLLRYEINILKQYMYCPATFHPTLMKNEAEVALDDLLYHPINAIYEAEFWPDLKYL